MDSAAQPHVPSDELCILAGKCDWDGKTVTPDKRRGTLSVSVSSEDGLTHVKWTCRDTGHIEDDLIVIRDAYLEKVSVCAGGRVYVMRYTSSDKVLLIWMQEPDEDRDEERVKAFNSRTGVNMVATKQLNHPAAPTVTRTQSVETAAVSVDDPLKSDATAIQTVDKAELKGLMDQFVTEWSNKDGGVDVPLEEVLRADVLCRLIKDPDALSEIKSFLPESHSSCVGQVEEALRSAQLQQSIRSLHDIITHSDEQLPLLLASMGLSLTDADPAATTGNVSVLERFLRAIAGKHGVSQDTKATASDDGDE